MRAWYDTDINLVESCKMRLFDTPIEVTIIIASLVAAGVVSTYYRSMCTTPVKNNVSTAVKRPSKMMYDRIPTSNVRVILRRSNAP